MCNRTKVQKQYCIKHELVGTDLEYDVELGVEIRLQALPLQDGLKLVQKLERVLDRGDVLEALVDKRLRKNTRTHAHHQCTVSSHAPPQNIAKDKHWWIATQPELYSVAWENKCRR